MRRTRLNLISSRLATKAQIRQVDVSLRADAAAGAVDRAVGSLWAKVLDLLRRRPDPWEARQQARELFRNLLPVAATQIDRSLCRVAAWGYKSSVRDLTGTLSTKYLKAAAAASLLEASPPLAGAAALARNGGRILREDRPRKYLNDKPGVVQIALKAMGFKGMDLGKFLREPIGDEMSEEAQREIFSALLFPPPDEGLIAELVYGTVKGVSWLQRLDGATRTSARPEDLAEIVGGGFALGKSAGEVARDLLPVVDNVRSTARRIARTESLRISHGAQMNAFAGLGDLVIGYQIHATLDQHTRPEHSSRNGTIYFANPGQGQKGYDERPDPPLEADGSIAWNCLLPGNFVQGRVQAALKARYSGEALEIRTRCGFRVTLTVNHPVLTKNGFVAAGKINQGDNLVSYMREDQSTVMPDIAVGDYVKNAPARIEHIFGAFEASWAPVGVKRASVIDLHGDGKSIDGDIRVVRPNGLLGDNSNSHFFQLGNQGFFRRPHVEEFLFPGSGMKEFGPQSPFSASGVFSGSLGASNSQRMIGRQPGPLSSFRFGLAPDRNSFLREPIAQSLQRNAGLFAEGFNRLSRHIPFNQSGQTGNPPFLRFGHASELNSCFANPFPDRGGDDTHLFGQLQSGFPGKIFLDEVILIKRFHYEGPVYDVETTQGFYVASCEKETSGGPVLHNCRCHLSPVLSPDPAIASNPELQAVFANAQDRLVPDPVAYSDWFAQADEKRRRTAVGSRRYAAVKDLVGDNPDWSHFLDPESGQLLSLDRIKSEGLPARLDRVNRVQTLMAQRAHLIRQVQTFGFLAN